MPKMVFDESYGELTYALRSAIRKYNVSPADYWDLEYMFGEGNYPAIQEYILRNSSSGMYVKDSF